MHILFRTVRLQYVIYDAIKRVPSCSLSRSMSPSVLLLLLSPLFFYLFSVPGSLCSHSLLSICLSPCPLLPCLFILVSSLSPHPSPSLSLRLSDFLSLSPFLPSICHYPLFFSISLMSSIFYYPLCFSISLLPSVFHSSIFLYLSASVTPASFCVCLSVCLSDSLSVCFVT